MRKKYKKQKQLVRRSLGEGGFTLIELLVVISIIGLLASVVLVALNGARQKSRVTKRVADLSQIAKALELYYSDNGSYPNNGPSYRSQCTGLGSLPANSVVLDITLGKGLVASSTFPGYISSFPSDPSMAANSNQNCYIYISNGTDYKLLDYNITDMTLAQINQYPTFKDPCRNDAVGSPCGFSDPTLGLSVRTPNGNW